jgi:succinoglycan biosynthesis protein ExoM
MTDQPGTDDQRTSVAVYACTYQRNDMLRALLDSLVVAADHAQPLADVGVVIVDDNPDGRARTVTDDFADAFPLGLQYVHVGGRNIADARNAGLEASIKMAEWFAVTDDDCTPSPQWITELVSVQRRYDCDAVGGPFVRLAPDDAPRWLTEQPFLTFGEPDIADGAPTDYAGTGNSLWRSAFFLDHPEIRYQSSLGLLGGEDAVFARQALAAGVTIRYARHAIVFSLEDAVRQNYRYRLRAQLWLGNTTSVTNLRLGSAGRGRLAARGVKRLGVALVGPIRRLVQRGRPQLRYTLFEAMYGVGIVLGAIGMKIEHR